MGLSGHNPTLSQGVSVYPTLSAYCPVLYQYIMHTTPNCAVYVT